jgi:hypothetical protein
MNVILSTLAVAFAALCVWLTVRIVNRRERWANWTLALLVLPVCYCLSTGPVVWLYMEDLLPSWADVALRWFYLPLYWIEQYSPDWAVNTWWAYAEWWGYRD